MCSLLHHFSVYLSQLSAGYQRSQLQHLNLDLPSNDFPAHLDQGYLQARSSFLTDNCSPLKPDPIPLYKVKAVRGFMCKHAHVGIVQKSGVGGRKLLPSIFLLILPGSPFQQKDFPGTAQRCGMQQDATQHWPYSKQSYRGGSTKSGGPDAVPSMHL